MVALNHITTVGKESSMQLLTYLVNGNILPIKYPVYADVSSFTVNGEHVEWILVYTNTPQGVRNVM